MESELEFRRKLFHLFFGVSLAGLIFYNVLDRAVLGIITVIVAIVFLIAKNRHIPGIEWLLEKFERRDNRKHFPGKGLIFFLLGAEIVLLLFGKEIAIPSILILAIGDAIPDIIGMYYKKVKYQFTKEKSIEGSIAGFVLAFLSVLHFIVWFEALFACIIAIVIEALDLQKYKLHLDDNLIMPLAAGLTIWIIRLFI